MSIPERVRHLIEPLVDDHGLVLYDLDLTGGVLRVVVDQPVADEPANALDGDRPTGVGMDAITPLTRAISRALDEHDPIDGRFTLEVSSPGLERTLRTPDHYRGAIGLVVSIKTSASASAAGGERRLRGELTEADDDGVVVVPEADPDQPRRLAYPEIERARTVFEWGPAPKPGGSARRTKRSASTTSRSSKSPKKTTKKVTAS